MKKSLNLQKTAVINHCLRSLSAVSNTISLDALKSELKAMKDKYEEALQKIQELEKPTKGRRKRAGKNSETSQEQEPKTHSRKRDQAKAEQKPAPVEEEIEEEEKEEENDSILKSWKERLPKKDHKPKEDATKKLLEISICSNCSFLIRKNETSINCATCNGNFYFVLLNEKAHAIFSIQRTYSSEMCE